MKEFIEYILQFGDLAQQQIEFISTRAKESTVHKNEYFIEAGKVLRQVGFILEGVFRVCYYTNKGEEITRYFVDENHLIFSLYENEPFTEYVQAITDCKLIVFSNQDWKEISESIGGWELILQKIIQNTLVEKLERRSPLVAQDATTRYLLFIEKFPNLANRIPLSYLASYLGITQSSLSRIRKNINL